MKYILILIFSMLWNVASTQRVHVGTSADPSILRVTHPSDSAAIIWDNGDARLYGAQDAFIWNRAKFRFLLDANNDNGVASQFSLFSDVSQGDNTNAPVNFNLNGGKSWVDSGNFGIGNKNPTSPLEVSGIIHTNQGGVKFPDQTIQTTAAVNSDPANEAQPRLMGFLVINNLTGPIDTTLHFPQGASFSVNGFPIYHAQQEVVRTDPVNLDFEALMMTTDITEQAPLFYQRLITGQLIDSVSLFFIQEGFPSLLTHYSIQLETCTVKSCKNEIQPAGSGKYAHLLVLGISYTTIKWLSHVNPSNGFCWDVGAQAECGNGGG